MSDISRCKHRMVPGKGLWDAALGRHQNTGTSYQEENSPLLTPPLQQEMRATEPSREPSEKSSISSTTPSDMSRIREFIQRDMDGAMDHFIGTPQSGTPAGGSSVASDDWEVLPGESKSVDLPRASWLGRLWSSRSPFGTSRLIPFPPFSTEPEEGELTRQKKK